MIYTAKHLSLVLLACILLCMSSCLVPGKKLLRMDVFLEGDLVATTQFSVNDSSSVTEMWDAAGAPPISAEILSPIFRPLSDDPTRLELKGSILLTINHVETLEASASVENLTLIRSSATATDWRLPGFEVEGAKEAGGF